MGSALTLAIWEHAAAFTAVIPFFVPVHQAVVELLKLTVIKARRASPRKSNDNDSTREPDRQARDCRRWNRVLGV